MSSVPSFNIIPTGQTFNVRKSSNHEQPDTDYKKNQKPRLILKPKDKIKKDISLEQKQTVNNTIQVQSDVSSSISKCKSKLVLKNKSSSNESVSSREPTRDPSVCQSSKPVQNHKLMMKSVDELSYDFNIPSEYKNHIDVLETDNVDIELLKRLPSITLPTRTSGKRERDTAHKKKATSIVSSSVVSQVDPDQENEDDEYDIKMTISPKNIRTSSDSIHSHLKTSNIHVDGDTEVDADIDVDLLTKYKKGDKVYMVDYDKGIVYNQKLEIVGEVDELGEMCLADSEAEDKENDPDNDNDDQPLLEQYDSDPEHEFTEKEYPEM